MRQLFIAILLFVSCQATAQDTVRLVTGTNKYITIDNKNYERGYVGSAYYYSGTDSTLGINVNSAFPKILYSPRKRYYYTIDGVRATSMAALRAWMNTNFEPVDTGGGGTVTLAEHQIAFGSATNEVTGSDKFQWDNSSGIMTLQNPRFLMYMYATDVYALDVNTGGNYTELGFGGNKLYLGNDLVSLSSGNSDVDLRPDGIASVWGSQIVTEANLPGQLSNLPAITSVNSINAVGNGIGVIVAEYFGSGILVAGSTAVIDYTPTNSNGYYQMTIDGYVTNTRLNSLTLAYTDPYGNSISEDVVVVLNNATTANSAANWGTTGVKFDLFRPITFRATTTTHITLTASVSGGSPNIGLNVTLIRLN